MLLKEIGVMFTMFGYQNDTNRWIWREKIPFLESFSDIKMVKSHSYQIYQIINCEFALKAHSNRYFDNKWWHSIKNPNSLNIQKFSIPAQKMANEPELD